jgi:hypothetical protein
LLLIKEICGKKREASKIFFFDAKVQLLWNDTYFLPQKNMNTTNSGEYKMMIFFLQKINNMNTTDWENIEWLSRNVSVNIFNNKINKLWYQYVAVNIYILNK